MNAPEKAPVVSGNSGSATRHAWIMLIALSTAFCLSQAYRTVAAMMANQMQTEFNLTTQQLGIFAGAFHLSFGAMQFFMGIGIDLHGVRRTVLTAFPLSIAGAALAAVASQYGLIILGQILIGIGCAPAFLVCTVFISRFFPQERFAAISGLILGIGSVGMLLTGTPLAWVIDHGSWRTGFAVLAAGSAVAWLVIFMMVREPGGEAPRQKVSLLAAMKDFAAMFAIPHTWGIVVLGAMTYASFMALRGLWLGPLLIHRFQYSLVESGNVALAISVVSVFGPPVFGRLDHLAKTRRRRIALFTTLLAGLFALIAVAQAASIVVAASVVLGFVSGYMVWQYADVRSAYPPEQIGRAMAVFTMAMFLGIALMQWLTGLVADFAGRHGMNPYTAVPAAIGVFLMAGVFAFLWLPAPAAHGGDSRL